MYTGVIPWLGQPEWGMCVYAWRGQVHKAHAWPVRVPSLLVTLLWLDLSLELGRNSRDTRGSPSISFLEWYRVSGCLRVGAPISGCENIGVYRGLYNGSDLQAGASRFCGPMGIGPDRRIQ